MLFDYAGDGPGPGFLPRPRSLQAEVDIGWVDRKTLAV